MRSLTAGVGRILIRRDRMAGRDPPYTLRGYVRGKLTVLHGVAGRTLGRPGSMAPRDAGIGGFVHFFGRPAFSTQLRRR